MSRVLRDAVKARLEAQIPSRTVYAGAVPDGSLPVHYLVVWASNGGEFSSRFCDSADTTVPVVWVTSVSRNNDPTIAADEAEWGADKVREALRGWRPSVGSASWKVTPQVSQPAMRDESITQTTFYAVEQFTAQYQL